MIDKDIQAYLAKASPELREAFVAIAVHVNSIHGHDEAMDAIFSLTGKEHIAVRAAFSLMNKDALAEIGLASLLNGIPKRRGRPPGSPTRKKQAAPRYTPTGVRVTE